MLSISQFFNLLRKAFSAWQDAKVSTLGASVAFYTTFSIAPLLVIMLAIATLIFGDEAARGGLAREMEGMLGLPVAKAVQELLANAQRPGSTPLALVSGIAILLFGASGVFNELQGALDTIWQVQPRPGRIWWQFLQDRVISFSLVLATCFILLTSLIVSVGLEAAEQSLLAESLPGGAYLWQGVHGLAALGVITLLFAVLFKFLPDARVSWNDVWLGAVVTAILFSVGRLLLAWYLGQASVASAYGAAGSLVILLLWVYYTAQIFLYGAAFTRIYANHCGRYAAPTKNAVPVRPGEVQAKADQALQQ